MRMLCCSFAVIRHKDGLRYSGTLKVLTNTQKGNNGINANFVFPCIIIFLQCLYNMIFVNMKLDSMGTRALDFNVEDSVSLVYFRWHSQNKVDNIAILVLQRVFENIRCSECGT